MISLKAYSWLSKDVTVPEHIDENALLSVLNTLNADEMPDCRKEALARYYIDSLSSKDKKRALNISADSKSLKKQFNAWSSGNAFSKVQQQVYQNDHTKFMMCSLAIIMAGTICIYFLRAVITGKFLVNFSVDAIIVSIAIAFLAVNFKKKYEVIARYEKKGHYILFDIVSFLLCVLLKFIIPAMFDLSVIILFITYYIEKKQFEKTIRAL